MIRELSFADDFSNVGNAHGRFTHQTLWKRVVDRIARGTKDRHGDCDIKAQVWISEQ
jgi:hypothetical protein